MMLLTIQRWLCNDSIFPSALPSAGPPGLPFSCRHVASRVRRIPSLVSLAVVGLATVGLATVGLAEPLSAQQPETTDNEVNFATEIQPILARRCFACHGPDQAEAGLRLHEPDQAFAKLE